MEKLQSALRNARQNRGDQPERPAIEEPPRKRSGGGGGNEQTAPDLWKALTPFTPADKVLTKNRLVSNKPSASATPFDILRTKILLQMKENGWKRLAITSPMPRSGKTTTACNLALGFGRQKELRSMLFDLDLRDPSVQYFFDQEPTHSMGSMLRGDVDFQDQAFRIGLNVAVSMAGHAVQDPTRILLGDEVRYKLDEIQEVYDPDVMIFDVPSVLVGDDTRAFLKNVDCALIIARAGSTRYSQFDVCEQEIAAQTNVLGVVVNAVDEFVHGGD